MNERWLRRTAWLGFVLCVILALPVSARVGKNVASEFLEQAIEEEMAAADILLLLALTVGATASSNTQPLTHQLREGLFVTALPQGPNVLLRVEVMREDTDQRETITEVALSAELSRTFVTLVEAALTTAGAIFTTQQFAAPWELQLHAESPSGGEAVVKVTVFKCPRPSQKARAGRRTLPGRSTSPRPSRHLRSSSTGPMVAARQSGSRTLLYFPTSGFI